MDCCCEKKKWSPKTHHVICNAHFIGKKKSDDPASPSYAPTLFPPVYHAKQVNERAVLSRYNRLMNRRKTLHKRNIGVNCDTGNQVNNDPNNVVNNSGREPMDISSAEVILKSDQECQVDFVSSAGIEQTKAFTCNRYIYMTNYCDAEVQTEIPEIATLKTIVNRKKMKDEEVQCGTSLTDRVDKSVGFNEAVVEQNRKQRSFCGFPSIKTDEDLLDIAGVNFQNFNFLLSKTENPSERSTITREQRLLIFLVKIKTGLTFSAIAIFFGLHRSTISKIFFSTLQYLNSSTANLVFWPSRAAVQKTMPECFKPQYSNTRVIIDCTEFKIDVPSSVDDRIYCYFHYKKGFTAKVLIGIIPSGFICFKSKVAGGRKGDSQLTIESNLVDSLEDGDVVLADKGFPEIRSIIDASGKRVLLIMPPFLEKKSEFSKEETDLTYNIARVRIHVERIMQRLKTYQILYKIPEHLFFCIDNIIHVICGLVNLQPPIFSNKTKTIK
nr:uncharacterized protein LOC124215812 isoform X2 [Neodiprion pinetum]